MDYLDSKNKTYPVWVHEIYFSGLPDFGLNILSASPPLYIMI